MLKKMNKNTKSNLITYGIVIVAFVVMQLLISTGSISSLLEGLMVPLCMYIILAVSLNLVVGILGELSLGHAGFMCVGAFSSAFFSKCMADVITIAPLRFFLALLVGIASAAVFGIIIGIPVLRLKGDYLAIVTLAFGEIIKNLVNVLFIGKDSNGFHFSTKDVMGLNMEPDGTVIVNGPQGITGTPKDSTFLIGVILILITLFIVINLTNSRDGRAIMAIRDNRIAAESVGINVTKYKLMAFTISAALAGAAGVLYSHNLSTLTANTNNFGYNMSINILVFVVLGGIGSIRGSMIAAVILTLLPELLRGLSDYRMLIYAIVLILMMLFNWAPKSIEWREKYLSFGKKEKGGCKIMGALLDVKNLGISFGGLRAVNGFDISIEKEELYGLIGPNGAGKTTVFNLLTGVYKPDAGQSHSGWTGYYREKDDRYQQGRYREDVFRIFVCSQNSVSLTMSK